MDDLREEAVRCLQVEIVKCLDPTEYVLDYLLKCKGLTDIVYERISKAENRTEMNRMLLVVVKRKKIVPLFINALKYKESHVNLATQVEGKIEELKNARLMAENDIGLFSAPHKFEIKGKMSKFITKLHYYLKTLSHDGDLDRFNNLVSTVRRDYSHVPDIQFYLLEAEFAKNRVYYHKSSVQGTSLEDMERLIAYTTNPLVCSMVFLARKGSVLSMKGELDHGLHYLQLARGKADFIKPCKDTGTVLYIHINLLLEHYESHPVPEIKEKLIKDIAEAIVHFSKESPLMREDYTRLFLLKMAFCYLGIGVFGKTIACSVTEKDLKAAESCLRKIKSIKGKFDRRRQMFYCLARSVLKHRRGYINRAVELAAEAADHATRGGFKKELSSVKSLSEILQKETSADEDMKKDIEEDLFRDLEEMERDDLLTPSPVEKQGHFKRPRFPLCVLSLVVFCIILVSLTWIGGYFSWMRSLFIEKWWMT